MKRKIYVVTNKESSQVYRKWGFAFRKVHGVKGARVESCGTEKEANTIVRSNNRKLKALSKSEETPMISLYITDDDAVAFTDGSFSDSNCIQYSIAGIGVVYFDKQCVKEVRYHLINQKQSKLRNIFAEIEAVRCAILMAVNDNKKSITICHDYNGIAMWAQNQWEARCPFTVGYVQFIKKMSEKINIRFVNVKGHSNVKYNELANLLAEVALIEGTEKAIRWYKNYKVPKGSNFIPTWGLANFIDKEHLLEPLDLKLKMLKEFRR